MGCGDDHEGVPALGLRVAGDLRVDGGALAAGMQVVGGAALAAGCGVEAVGGADLTGSS